ncbi:MAG: flavodoxin-dependent (E)-4-hydroxy-3-methylbut-2-enyl-diphosphate synthase [Desulfosalsimonas sp.]
MPFCVERKKTRQIRVGSVKIGGGSPIAVQSMTNTPTADVAATVSQIRRLEQAGCEIIRTAVADMESAKALALIKKQISIPLVADIHFDHRLAIASAEAGADCLRINPGNIGSKSRVQSVVRAAADCGASIRTGVNAGSLDRDLRKKHGGPNAEALVESALRQTGMLADMDFHEVKVSIKSSDVLRTIGAYRLFSEKSDIPLHIGITEAGGLYSGIVKSSIGIGAILLEGIGDTLRVSLTRDPVEEVRVGYEILKALGIRRRGPEIISCPTCGRCRIDLFTIADSVEKALLTNSAPIKVAIMGCEVNGPGEAKEADVGIAGGDGTGVLFKKGRVVKRFPQDRLVEELLSAVDEISRDRK